MTIGIIVAMEEELHSLQAALVAPQTVTVAGQQFYSGSIEGNTVVVAEAGIGKVQAAMTATIMVERFAPSALINTGSAGGIGSGMKVGDVVLSSGVAYHDVDVTAFNYLPGQLPQRPQIFEADAKLVDAIAQAAVTTGLVAHTGLIVSGDQFIASDAQIAAIKAIYPQVLAAEMEGAAIGQVAAAYGLPFVVIRAMSDTADDHAAVSFDEFVVDAGKRSAAMLINYLKQTNE